ncbi:MAG: DNA/RNA nuclease SfsA [Firmicutes bacterium]|nr:DNA/RNA nuclease SfsA [Bacillota bacterium]
MSVPDMSVPVVSVPVGSVPAEKGENVREKENGVRVEYGGRLCQGIFLERPNRFVARVAVGGQEEIVHVANPGRMTELLVPGAPIWLAEKVESGGKDATEGKAGKAGKAAKPRKTRFQLALVDHRGVGLISVDSNLPNRLVYSLLRARAIPEFAEYDLIAKEVKFGQSRFDFRLDRTTGQGIPLADDPPGANAAARFRFRMPSCFLEVKSVNLVVGREARFPDAPTLRGARHLAELARARREGCRAAVLFVIQRDDPVSFAPHVETDPDFGEAFRSALEAGVEAYAYTCRLDSGGISLGHPVPVKIQPGDRDFWRRAI